MLDFLLWPENQPFAVAALILFGLLAMEIVTLCFGTAMSHLVDAMFHLHVDHAGHIGKPDHGEHWGPFGTALDWINPGRVPVLVMIMAALGCFSMAGFALQGFIGIVHPLPAVVASLIAFLAAIPGTRHATGLVARVVPRDESYVTTGDDLVGRTGFVTFGPVTSNSSARFKVQDQHGNWHFPWGRLAEPGDEIATGEQVLLVERRGAEFAVRRAPSAN